MSHPHRRNRGLDNHHLNNDNTLTDIKDNQTNGENVIQTKLNTNHTGSGSVHFATCDAQGRTYINSDLGIPINALQDNNAVQSLRCENGSLRVNDFQTFSSVVVLKNNESIASGYYQFISGLHKRGQKITVMVRSDTGSNNWNLQIEQSLDNSQFIATGSLINDGGGGGFGLPSDKILSEFTTIAPYWRLTFQNTSSASNFTIKYIT